MRVAFIGLGVMGFPMAGHLSRAGYEVSVYNRTSSVAERWCETFAGTRHASPAAAAEKADTIFCCVGNDDDLRAVMLGEEGILSGAPAGGLVVDHTTASAELARVLFSLAAAQHVEFVDAPVSGGQAGAENGQLAIMAGGTHDGVARASEIMGCYAKSITHIGEPGTGQLAKAVNQICIAGILQGLAEALHFAQCADLDVPKVIEAISKGAAQSWQMDNRWQTMIDSEFDFGFAVDWMRKDLAIAIEEAKSNGARLEMAKLVDSYYAEVQAMGGSRWDTSSLIARLDRKS